MAGQWSSTRLILEATNFAAAKHINQRRKTGDTPYINHPIGVAHIIATEGRVEDPKVLAAAILHDTIEDTDTTFEELKENFGEDIAQIVQECSDDKDLGKQERKKQQIEHAGSASREAKLVKLADKLYNLRDLTKAPPPDWSEDRLQGYFGWSKRVIEKIRGTNEGMESALDAEFAKEFVSKDGGKMPYVPDDWETRLL